MATVTLSLLQGQQVVDSVDGQMIVLPFKVEGFSIAPGISDSTVLTRIRPLLPAPYAAHPDGANYPNATLRDVLIKSVNSFSVVFGELIYKAPGISTFTLEEIDQTEYLRTFTNSDGSKNLTVWYLNGGSNTANTPPPNLSTKSQYAVDVQRFFGKRIIKATGWMKYSDWQNVRAKIRAVRWHTNFLQWGDDPVADATGCWLFMNMRTFTNDLNITKIIELYFLNDPRGHYPVGGWLDELGNHPTGGATEKTLRALGPPPMIGSQTDGNGVQHFYRDQWNMNGLSMFGVYPETTFQLQFSFDPSQA